MTSAAPLITYGCPAAEFVAQNGGTQREIELTCFYHAWPEDKGGLGRYGHAVNAINQIYNQKIPTFIWNDWTEWMIYEFCYNREVTISGPGASWKTTCMGGYGHLRWLSSPLTTRGIFTSTTMQALRSKIWKEVLRFHRSSQCSFGNVVNHPQPKIQSIKGDDAYGLFGIAVEQGDVEKAVENIKGMHAPDTFVMVDEETGVSMAIVDAGANLEKGTRWYQLVGAGNPVDQYDTHGTMCEPKDGWRSVSVETDKWITKRGGICIHLDGLKAPNVVAGKAKYPGMLTFDDVETSKKRDGENSPTFWSQVRGFWPPEGISSTVFSHTMIEKFKARAVVPGDGGTWVSEPIIIAGCDPAFEGEDRKPLGFAKCGKIDDGGTTKDVICFTELILMKVDVTVKEPIHYQLQRQIMEGCKARGVPPKYFGLDSTGEGGGVASILKREWGEGFLEVEFGGKASDQPISNINPRPAYEEYANKVTELHFRARSVLENGQMRGLYLEAAREACERHYEMRGPRKIVESKKIMKLRIGHSPDILDLVVIMVAVAIERGLISTDVEVVIGNSPRENWKDFAKRMMPESDYATA